MRFAVTSYGTRGDIEPCVAVARELVRRGHEVRMAVPPDLVDFVESAGLSTSAFGLEVHAQVDGYRDFWAYLPVNFWRVRNVISMWREMWQGLLERWEDISKTLTPLTEGTDLLLTGPGYQDVAANIAEFHDIPLATLNYFPMRPNGQIVPNLPAPLIRSVMKAHDWMAWRFVKEVEDAQRRQLQLPKATCPLPRRIVERGSLEIQAYDEVCFPGLAAEWAKWEGQRPFVGTLTTELTREDDDEVALWIADGTPPIYFGFGSIPLKSPAETIEMIGSACAKLGQRALVCSGWTDFSCRSHFDHVKVMDAVNHATVFPACRAVVHHGGSGTTGAGLRAGVPALILWTAVDQPLFAAQVKRLKVGFGRRFSTTTEESLITDLRRILAPEYATRARELATQITKPAASVDNAADLLEGFARSWRLR
jgi:UDP:flavonoid glycosyltransferase YjiC (YdhE family)